MKKILLLGLVMLSTVHLLKIRGQNFPFYSDCSPLKFNGISPAPWAIDGKIDDWQTILGPLTGDPALPFGPTLGQNAYYHPIGFFGPNPGALTLDPENDLRVLANIRDDHNVYFYFRRLGKANSKSKIFYFLDTNLNGKMEAGEPVICVNIQNSQKISSLSIGRYNPQRQGGDWMYVDGCSGLIFFRTTNINFMGSVTEIMNSDNTLLYPNEKFEAAVTEKGFGVEMAIPWRLINPANKYFAYRVALQSGSGTYTLDQYADNASCGNKAEIIGSPDFRVLSKVTSTIIPGASYRTTVTLENLTPYSQVCTIADEVLIKNIVRNFTPAIETTFTVKVNGTPYGQVNGSFNQQPIIYTDLNNHGLTPQIGLPPFGTRSFSIDINFPSDGSVKSAKIEFNPKTYFYYFINDDLPNTCGSLGDGGGGGKPINPVGFDLGVDETTTIRTNMSSSGVEETGIEFGNKVKIYPNPSTGNFNVVLPATGVPAELILTDYTGKVIRKWSGVQRVIRIENLKTGFYLLHIKSDKGEISTTKKIVVH